MATLNPLFIRQIEELGIEENRNLAATLCETQPTVSVRLNRRKLCHVDFEITDPVPWLQDRGFYLTSRPMFTLIPQMHQGAFYVQDASSMFISHVIRQITKNSNPVTYLDACAAPGGKTTAAIDALPEGSLVVANEYDFKRASILTENIIKWGYPDVVVSRGDTRKFRKLQNEFDIIAADVPCSGEGMFRKDSEAVNQWSPSLVNECAERQKEIIDNLWDSLRPGGFFIYSTCTFNRKENEDMVTHILDNYDAESVEIKIDSDWGIVKSPVLPNGIYAYRFIPGIIRGEGLFMTVFKKAGEYISKKEKNAKKPKQNKPDVNVAKVADRILMPTEFEIKTEDDKVIAFPAEYIATLNRLSKNLDIIHHGICLATIKGKDLIPSQSLAMSDCINTSAFPNVIIDTETALQYLRRETVTLPDDTPRGFVLLIYDNLPLGFVKNIGNRANNLYPEQWRILKKN